MIIGIDCDGVLTDLASYIFEYGEKWFKRKPDNPSGYSIREVFNCTEKEETRFGLKYFFWYCKKWPPRENSVEIINKLNEDGHELYEISARKFVTMRTPLGLYSKVLYKRWLKKNGFRFADIFCCAESSAPEDKLMYCRKCSVDIMIDDKPDVVLYLAEHGIRVLMFDAPYNRDVVHDNIVRVYDWVEIYDLILKEKTE